MSDPRQGRPEYVPLMTLDNADGDGDEEASCPERNHRPGLSKLTTASVYSALLVSLLAFLASATSFLKVYQLPSPAAGPGGLDLLNTLRRPSLYVGLERAPEIKNRLQAERILGAANPGMMHGGGHDHGHETAGGEDNGDHAFPTRAVRINSIYPDTPASSSESGWVLISDWVCTSNHSFSPLYFTSTFISYPHRYCGPPC